MLEGDNDSEIGLFIPHKGETREIPRSFMHQAYPNTKGLSNPITQLSEVSPGVFERYVKVSKEIVNYDSLTYKQKVGYLSSSSEPRCIHSLGSFLKYTSELISKK
jgi:hypothetical protein